MSTNVTSVEPVQRINPELAGSPNRVDSDSAAQAGVPVRRLTRLDADYYAMLDSVRTRSIPRPRVETRPSRPDQHWLRVLERAVGGWAPTLRGSVAVLAVFAFATILLVIALGPVVLAAAGGLLLVGMYLNASERLPRA